MRAAVGASSVDFCAPAFRIFGAETSMPVTVAPGSAAARRNTSEPVPHPRSSTSSVPVLRTCCNTSSHIRAERAAGAEQVCSANSLRGNVVHDVYRTGEIEALRMRADVIEKAAIRIEHPLIPAESPLAVREQHHHAAR